MRMADLVLVFFIGGSALLTLGSVLIVVWTVVRGMFNLRFSLRTLMLMVVSGAICVTLLMNRSYPLISMFGWVLSAMYVTTLGSYLLLLGGVAPNSSAVRTDRGTASANGVTHG